MRRDRTKSILSIIATLVSAALILVYWLVPADHASHPLYKLFFDCIPDSLVVLITIPIVYWLLYTRGLTNMGDCPLFSGHSRAAHVHSHHQSRPAGSTVPRPANPTRDEHRSDSERDVLVVAAASHSPDPADIITPLNATLRIAETRQMLVIFTKCYLPPEHPPARQGRTKKSPRTSAGTRSTKLPKDLYKPADSVVFDFPVRSQTAACSAMPDAALDMVISNPKVRTVYVAGFAAESCVQAICQIALQHGRKTIALENAIATSADNPDQIDKTWHDLAAQGLLRQQCLTPTDPDSAT